MTRTLTTQRLTITSILPTDWVAGRNITAHHYIVEQLRAGVDPITAAQTAGIPPPEFLAYMREGALVAARLNTGGIWETDFTPDQQDAYLFAADVNRAHATHIATLSVTAEQLARGGVQARTTRTKTDANGTVVEVVETVETTLPDPSMVRWKLEKLEPSIFGAKATLNVTVVDLTDTDSAADMQLDRMLDVARQLGNQSFIDTTATELLPDEDDDE